jgi:arylsulfatase A-like enzyme
MSGGRKVLLIVTDQWRGDHLGCLGHPHVRTPHLDRLAREGTLFARHYAQGTPCGPSRASIMSGQYVMNHRVATNWTPTSAALPTLPKLLRAAGVAPYLIGYTTTVPDPRVTPHGDPRFRGWSIAEGWEVLRPFEAQRGAYLSYLAERGYGPQASYEAHFAAAGRSELTRAPFAPEDHDTAWLGAAARSFLGHPPQGDWLLHFGLFRPHPPLAAPASFLEGYAGCTPPAPAESDPAATHPYVAALRAGVSAATAHPALPGLASALDADTVAELRRAYYALCTEVDAEIGHALQVLEETGQLEDTLVIVTSDHGEQLGDHGLFGKRGLHGSSFHVPLIVRMPGGATDQRIDAFTESVDLLPTILDWLGEAPPLHADGRSLLPFLRGERPADWRTAAVYEQDFRDLLGADAALELAPDEANFAAIRDEDYAYVHFAGLPPALYDLRDDPDERRDLAGQPAYGPVVADYATRLLTHRLRHGERSLTRYVVTPGGLQVQQ